MIKMQSQIKLASIVNSSSLWILFALLPTILTLCEASNVWDGDLEAPVEILEVNYRKQFEKINEFLTSRVQTNELQPNIKKASEWYNQLLSSNFIFPQERKTIKALQLFLSLNDLEDRVKCNMESYRILLQNDLSADSVAHQMFHESELDSLNRVQRIIHDSSVRHAESCYSRYPDLFKEIYYKMDPTMVRKVKKTFDWYIQSQQAEGSESDSQKIYNRFVFQPEALGAWNFAKAMIDRTEDLPLHSAPSNKIVSLLKEKGINKKKTRQLYKERVLEPCRYYFDQLKDVFIPARYDAVFHKEDDDDEYYMSWARFRLCNSLLGLDRKQLIKQMGKIYKETTAREEEETY